MIDKSKASEFISAGLVVIAPSVLGYVVGWQMGQNGPNDTVLAAVLPAVITAAGLLIFQKIV